MIMDSLEPIAFGEPHFHHLLNFDTFKAEAGGDEAAFLAAGRAGHVPPALVVRAADSSMNVSDSLNTPISTFMELPMFFGSSVVLPPPSVLAGKKHPPASARFQFSSCRVRTVYIVSDGRAVLITPLRRKTWPCQLDVRRSPDDARASHVTSSRLAARWTVYLGGALFTHACPSLVSSAGVLTHRCPVEA